MTPTKEIIEEQYGGLKEATVRWVFQQGVSTVLLILIVVGLWKGGPVVLQEQQAQRREFTQALADQQKSFATVIDKLTLDYEKERDEYRADVRSMVAQRDEVQTKLAVALAEMLSMLRVMEQKRATAAALPPSN